MAALQRCYAAFMFEGNGRLRLPCPCSTVSRAYGAASASSWSDLHAWSKACKQPHQVSKPSGPSGKPHQTAKKIPHLSAISRCFLIRSLNSCPLHSSYTSSAHVKHLAGRLEAISACIPHRDKTSAHSRRESCPPVQGMGLSCLRISVPDSKTPTL